MLNAVPLPNDLLRNPPWQDSINTWPLHESFLTVLGAHEDELDMLGFYLKFGLEINLGLRPTETLDAKKKPHITWRQAVREQFERDVKRGDTGNIFPPSMEIIYAQLSQIAEKKWKQFSDENMAWLGNWEKTQDFYLQARTSPNAKELGLARNNFLIAALHLLPPHLGGVEGMIEQRFASEHYGHGWWDEGLLELRTLPVRGHEQTILGYHEILWRLQRATEYFGIVPIVDQAYTQVHYSLWRKIDNVNVMVDDSEECLVLRDKMGASFQELLNRSPLGRFAKLQGFIPISDGPFVGSSRCSIIRTCPESWELRGQGSNGVTHIARDMYIITTAVTDALSDATPSPETAVALKQHQKIRKLITDHVSDDETLLLAEKKIQRIKRLTVASDYPRTGCPIMSCIEASTVGEDGYLDLPETLVLRNWRLLSELLIDESLFDKKSPASKKDFAWDVFSYKNDDKKIRNLMCTDTWQKLFKKVRVTPEGTLDASRVPDFFKPYFEGLRITGIRHDVHIPETRIFSTDFFNDRRLEDSVTARYIAAGLIAPGNRINPSPAVREAHRDIFKFIVQKGVGFDDEEICILLLELYGGDKKKMIRKYLQHALWSGMRDYLNFKKKFAAHDVPQPFAKHEALQTLMSFQEGVASGLERVSDLAKNMREFRRLARLLNDPEELFSFEHVSWFFRKNPIRRLKGRDMKDYYTDIPEEELKKVQEHFKTWPDDWRQWAQMIAPAMLQLVVAAQKTEEAENNILLQYRGQAGTLTKNLQNPDKAADHFETVWRKTKNAWLETAKEALIAEANRLLADRTPIIELRHQAAANQPMACAA